MSRGITATVHARVGTAPQIVATTKNRFFTHFRIACTERYRNGEGNWVVGSTTWLTAKAWDRLAQHLSASLRIGDAVVACGRLQTEQWFDREGKTRESLVLNLTSIGPDLNHTIVTRIRPSTPRKATTDEAAETEAAVQETGSKEHTENEGQEIPSPVDPWELRDSDPRLAYELQSAGADGETIAAADATADAAAEPGLGAEANAETEAATVPDDETVAKPTEAVGNSQKEETIISAVA